MFDPINLIKDDWKLKSIYYLLLIINISIPLNIYNIITYWETIDVLKWMPSSGHAVYRHIYYIVLNNHHNFIESQIKCWELCNMNYYVVLLVTSGQNFVCYGTAKSFN